MYGLLVQYIHGMSGLLFHTFHLFIIFLGTRCQVFHRLSVRCRHSTVKGYAHHLESRKLFYYLRSDITASQHTLIPTPHTIGILQACQLLHRCLLTAAHSIQIEKQSYATLLLGFVHRLCNPRNFFQQDIFQIGITLQVTKQRLLIATVSQPSLEHLLDARISLNDNARQGISIISGSPRQSVFVLRITRYRQCLNRIPIGVGSHLYSEATICSRLTTTVKQIRGRYCLSIIAIHLHRYGLRYPLLISQHRKVMTLTITELASRSRYSTNQNIVFLRYFETETYHTRFAFGNRELLRRTINYRFRNRVAQFDTRYTTYRLRSHINQRCRNSSLISSADEAWHIRLHHKLLLHYSFIRKHAII